MGFIPSILGAEFLGRGEPLARSPRHFGLWNASSALRGSAYTHAPWLLAEPLTPSPEARADCALLLPDRRRAWHCSLGSRASVLATALSPACRSQGWGRGGGVEWGGGEEEIFLDEMPCHRAWVTWNSEGESCFSSILVCGD